MSGGMPEIGSKISLISKADIRYEGRLFTVDPQECTIALASVRSFGTEDRETQYPIAPQSQVYDYILFRGSDIKDIRVVNNVPPMPNDPAIMQMQLQNQMGGHQNFQPQFPVMGHMGPQMGNFGPVYNAMGGGGSMGGMGSGLAPGSLPAGLSKQKQSEFNYGSSSFGHSRMSHELKDQASVLDNIIGGVSGGGAGGSRSTTPISGLSRKSPTADMAVQVNPRSSSREKKSNQYHQNNQRMQKDNRNHQQHDNQNRNQHDGRMMNDNQKHPMQQQNHQRNNQQNHQQQNRGWNRNNPRNRGRIRPQYDQQNFRQQGGPNQRRGQNKTIKFDSDYDFEQANNKFEELRLKLAKLKLGAGGEDAKAEQVSEEKVNGEVDKKDDSGNETGAGDNEHDEEGDVSVGYDKTKSFFDNISCEASTERNKGKNRTDWRQERKLNSETFGISSTRRGGQFFYHHNSFRGGRGGYFNRNSGGGGGGGYHRGGGGGYRGNFRGRNNNQRSNLNGGNGMPQQPQQQQPKPQQSSTNASAATVNSGQ